MRLTPRSARAFLPTFWRSLGTLFLTGLAIASPTVLGGIITFFIAAATLTAAIIAGAEARDRLLKDLYLEDRK